jgi:hypothetical protein
VTDDDGGDEHVQVSGDDRDTAVEVTEGDVMAKYIDNNHDDQVSVEDGAVLTKMLVQMEVTVGDLRNIQRPRSVMREPVKKSPPVQRKHVREPPQVRHDDVHEGGDLGKHDTADRDQEVLHANDVPVQEGEGAVGDPVAHGHGVVDDDPSNGGICANVDDTAEGLPTIDDGETMAEEEFEEVQVLVNTEPEVDKDEEGGGGVPTPDDREAGKLVVLMTKQECYGHVRGGGIAKSACGNCAFHAG